eukprot:TRINITY_DN4865_c0_g1_i1.p1 TRINITY_DN4865_c0_g1~~TRINITY_DN4865_c0_g1_i1.p1  ORF type:complete len:178 (+),score=10.68 TRINITY_DN4865_c0_g1_i1:199-732(+)
MRLQGLETDVLQLITSRLEATDLMKLAIFGCGLEDNEGRWELLLYEDFPYVTFREDEDVTWKHKYWYAAQILWTEQQFFDCIGFKDSLGMAALWREIDYVIYYTDWGDWRRGHWDVIIEWSSRFESFDMAGVDIPNFVIYDREYVMGEDSTRTRLIVERDGGALHWEADIWYERWNL